MTDETTTGWLAEHPEEQKHVQFFPNGASVHLFRELSPEEEVEFRAHARATYVIGEEINEINHPVWKDEARKMNAEAGEDMNQAPPLSNLPTVILEDKELIRRFNFEMRVMIEFLKILADIPTGGYSELMDPILSIEIGILALVKYAGLEEAPSVVEYMTQKIWGPSESGDSSGS